MSAILATPLCSRVPFRQKETWYAILNKYGTKNPSIHMAVCSDHFRPQDLDRDGFRSVLKKDAVPCLYLDRPKMQISESGTNDGRRKRQR